MAAAGLIRSGRTVRWAIRLQPRSWGRMTAGRGAEQPLQTLREKIHRPQLAVRRRSSSHTTERSANNQAPGNPRRPSSLRKPNIPNGQRIGAGQNGTKMKKISKGFVKKSYAPNFIASTAFSILPYAVMTITGNRHVSLPMDPVSCSL